MVARRPLRHRRDGERRGHAEADQQGEGDEGDQLDELAEPPAQGLTDKDKIDANFPQPRRLLSNGEEMILERIGLYIPSCLGNTVVLPRDVKKAAENFYLTVKLDRKEIADGPAYTYPAGYGLNGQTSENDAGIVNIGVPSVAAAPKLTRPHELDMNTDVEATGVWYDHAWDASNMPTLGSKVWHRLHFLGLLKAAATRAG